MARRAGLGRGLDGMFTSYIGKDSAKEKQQDSNSQGKNRQDKDQEDKNQQDKSRQVQESSRVAEKSREEKPEQAKKNSKDNTAGQRKQENKDKEKQESRDKKEAASKKSKAKPKDETTATSKSGSKTRPDEEATVNVSPKASQKASPKASSKASSKSPARSGSKSASSAKTADQPEDTQTVTQAVAAEIAATEIAAVGIAASGNAEDVVADTASGFAGEMVKETEVTSEAEKAAKAEKVEKAEKAVKTKEADAKGITLLKISQVEPNREQPRKEFQEEALQELAASIRQYGVIQPLVVQKRPDYYEIIAGERRWRAARMAGLKEVPVIIKDYTDQEIVEVSLIENIQREDLNPIEEALAYQRLLEEFSLKQEDIAKRVSKNRSTITNSLRLLKLDERVRQMLIAGELAGGHARALLGLEDKEQQYQAAQKIAAESMSVRDVERLIKSLKRGAAVKPKPKETDAALDLVCEDMAQRMKAVLGTQVRVNRKTKKAGRIEIEYYSMEELERIYDLIRGMQKG